MVKKLRKTNSKRYCINCKEIVKLVIEGLNGKCPYCGEILYTLNNQREHNK